MYDVRFPDLDAADPQFKDVKSFYTDTHFFFCNKTGQVFALGREQEPDEWEVFEVFPDSRIRSWLYSEDFTTQGFKFHSAGLFEQGVNISVQFKY